MNYWKRLTGDEAAFPLEVRIFHAVCIALMVGITVNIPLAIYMRIPQLAILLSTVVAFAGLLYYLSRSKGQYQLSVVVFQVFVNIALAANYYYNSGVSGPTYTIFLLAFFVTVATAPIKQHVVWLPLNILLIIGLMTAEYVMPGTVKITYPNAQSKYVDMVTSYVVIAGFAFLVTIFIRKAYNQQRQEVLDKTVALEASNATKNKLLSVLGHDLKEPLAALQGYLQILVDFDLEETERREIKTQLLAMTKNASIMLSNVLSWSKGQMQHMHANLQTLNVQATLSAVTELARSMSREKQVSLWIDIPEKCTVKADQHMLELIVRNLLMNAIKFTPTDGNIWLSVRTIDGQCTIRVRDDGVGMPESQQANIFSLEIASRAGTRSEKGTGLGLVLCREFTQLQGGQLTFKSKVGLGSTFYLKLPAGAVPNAVSEEEGNMVTDPL